MATTQPQSPASTAGASPTPKSPLPSDASAANLRKPPNFSEPIFVTIFAGTALQKFVVHKNALCHYSLFFRKAFDDKSDFIEGRTQEMKLEDIDSDIFGILVNWCYTQRLDHMERNFTHVELGKLWTLGDRFLMPGLQNDAMKVIVQPITTEVSEETKIKLYREFMEYAYSTPTDTALKRVATSGCVNLLMGGHGFVVKGQAMDFVDSFFGQGPAQDVLKELLNHFKAEISARQATTTKKSLFLVPEDT